MGRAAERAGADAAGDAEKRARLREIVAAKSLITGRAMKLASGRTSSHYFDMKPTTFDPEAANLIGELILDRLADDPPQAVAGLEMGALPVVMAVVIKSVAGDAGAGPPIAGFTVRKEPKDHGTRKLIERDIEPGLKVVAVDDVTTTAGSVIKAVRAIREAGGVVDRVVTVVDREEGAAANLAAEGLRLIALLTASEFDIAG